MRRWWFVGLWLIAASVSAQQADIVALERVRDAPAAPLTSAAIAALPQGRFEPIVDPHRLAPERDGRGWWRLQSGAVSGERLLLVYHPYSARITVATAAEYHAVTQTVFGLENDPRYSRRALVFPIGAGTVYIGVEGARYPLRIAIENAGQHAADDLGHTRVLSTMIGVLIGVSLLTSLFWLMLRERVYLLYAASMLMQVLYLLCAYGEAYALPGLRELGRFGAEGVWFVATLSTVLSTYFLLDFGELRERAPRLCRALTWIGAYLPMLLLVLLISPWPVDKAWFPLTGNLSLLAANVLALVTLFVAWRRGGRHAGFVLIGWVPLVVLSTTRAMQLSAGSDMTPWLEYGLPVALAFSAVVLGLGLADRMLAFRRERDNAQQHAERDALTGVFNRAGIERRLDWAIAHARDNATDLSVLFLDLDHFKQINDAHGHAAGDACLRALVRVIGEELHYGDMLGRYGGEEFLLVLPDSKRRQARDSAERIRNAVERRCAEIAHMPTPLTISIGLAEWAAEDSVASLVTLADEAMYAAKRAGRNRIVAA
ncbi:MAG: diguanylate cyclase, partial [Luteimonas sp.]